MTSAEVEMEIPEPERIESDGRNCIASFRRRFFAFAIDSLILGAVGSLILVLYTSEIIDLGWSARLIGLAIGIVYFAIQDSSICRGQTVGKRILGIRVVNESGGYISPLKAAARYVVLMLPPLCNNVVPDSTPLGLAAVSIAVVCLFGVGGSLLYLFLFNRTTKQSLHDLVVRSYVTSTKAPFLRMPALPKIHRLLLPIPVILSVVGSAFFLFTGASKKSDQYEKYLSMSEEVRDASGAILVSYMLGNTSVVSLKDGKSTTTHLTLKAISRTKLTEDETIAQKIVAIAIKELPESLEQDRIIVDLNYGASILVSSFNVSRRYVHSPQEWLDAINGSHP